MCNLKNGKKLSNDSAQNNGEQVPDADLHFLEVSVAQGKGTHYQEDQTLSRFREYEVLPAITNGKAGGLQQATS